MAGIFQIAIDGPSAAGKSTIAKRIAESLGIEYIDTGAMYRAVAYKMVQLGIDIDDDKEIEEMLPQTTIDFAKGKTFLDGIDVSEKIRTPKIARMASDASALPEIREKLVALQRSMGEVKSVIMDGRDIGTNVFPMAEYKYFLTASVKERASRRFIELKKQGMEVELASVMEDIAARDYNDSTRVLNPLTKAADAIEIDTTSLGIDEVASLILRQIKERDCG